MPLANPPTWILNPQLRISEQVQSGERVHVIQNPQTDDNFQIGEDEYAVARSFDGERSLVQIQEVLQEGGQPFELAELQEFAEQLVEAGLLVSVESHSADVRRKADSSDASPDRPMQPQKKPWALSRLLYVQLAAFNAERFFNATLNTVRPFLRLPALALATLTVLAALTILFGNWAELRVALSSRLSAATLVAVWFWYGVIVLVHEMAHGYVCAYFGGRVQTLGVLIMYGKPCAYCDVSDAWLFSKKSQKIWVMAAGSLLELFLWAAATLVWRVSAPETWIHGVALIVMTVCGIGTLFNFNPLLKYDGYYMLSDALEIANLRERAFRDLASVLFRRPREARNARERRVFLWYGLLAILYSALFLGYVFLRLQDWVHAQWGGTGLLLLWSAVTIAAGRPMSRGLLGFGNVVRRASLSRRVRWGLGALALLAILGLVRWPLKVASECRIEPLARVVVRAPIDGTIESVRVREGEAVDEGSVLLLFSKRDLDFALRGARAELRELEARLDVLEQGARQEEIAMARRRLESASAQLEFDLKSWKRAQQSFQSDLISRETVEEAERRVQLAGDEESSAKQALALLQAGSRPGEIEAMKAKLEVVRAEVLHLEDDEARSHVRSPIQGQVLTSHLDQLEGRYVERGDSLFVLADLSQIVLQIPVSEKDVGDVQLGAHVRFKARSQPQRVFEGEVVSIAPVASVSQRQRTVLVQSRIDNTEGLLVADASGFAKIYCGKRSLGGLLARRGVRMMRTEFWSLW